MKCISTHVRHARTCAHIYMIPARGHETKFLCSLMQSRSRLCNPGYWEVSLECFLRIIECPLGDKGCPMDILLPTLLLLRLLFVDHGGKSGLSLPLFTPECENSGFRNQPMCLIHRKLWVARRVSLFSVWSGVLLRMQFSTYFREQECVQSAPLPYNSDFYGKPYCVHCG